MPTRLLHVNPFCKIFAQEIKFRDTAGVGATGEVGGVGEWVKWEEWGEDPPKAFWPNTSARSASVNDSLRNDDGP